MIKKMLLELLFTSSLLTHAGIIEETELMDYTNTPAAQLVIKSNESNTRVLMMAEFLAEVLGDEFILEEDDEEES
jgi:hypothetical protein